MLCFGLVCRGMIVLVSVVSGEFLMFINISMCVLVVLVVLVFFSRLGFLLDCDIVMNSVFFMLEVVL